MKPASAAPAATGQRRPGRHRPGGVRTRWWVILAFMSPFVIGFTVFTAYPVITALYYSFTNFQMGSARAVKWVGFTNYANLFTGFNASRFWHAVRNTVWMVVVMVPVQTIWALAVAWVVAKVKHGAKIYRVIYYLPAMMPVVAGALAFIVMLNPAGVIDHWLISLGLGTPPQWFGDPAWSKPSLVMMRLWMVGNTMVIFSASLLDVPQQLYEAADLDGANGWRKFWHITLPSISPVIFFSLLTGVIYTFQYFTEAFVISGASNAATTSPAQLLGFPQDSLYFYTIGIYEQGFSYFKTGVASAMAFLLFLVIFAVTLVFIRVQRRLVYYSGDSS